MATKSIGDQEKPRGDVPGAIIVDQVGSGETGWFTTLQPNVPENRLFLMLMPNYHIAGLQDPYRLPMALDDRVEIARNAGELLFRATYAVAELANKGILENKVGPLGDVKPGGIALYGKSGTIENSQGHGHIKVLEVSGAMAQPFPPDKGHMGLTTQTDKEPHYVMSMPVTKSPLKQDVMEALSSAAIKSIRGIR
jgi:hypothetical protein